MRLVTVLAFFVAATPCCTSALPKARAQEPKQANEYIKLEVTARLKISERIDTDLGVLKDYSRFCGAEVHAADNLDFPRSLELFLGENVELPKLARTLNGKPVVVKGHLLVIHGPTRLVFGAGLEGPIHTDYSHARPRYVIRVSRLEAAPEAKVGEQQEAKIRLEVHGTLQSAVAEPSLTDVLDGKSMPSTFIRSNPCDLRLFIGRDERRIEIAKKLNGRSVIVIGELKSAPYPWAFTRGSRPFGDFYPPPYFFLNVSDLKSPLP
jgi:hypothetical protein